MVPSRSEDIRAVLDTEDVLARIDVLLQHLPPQFPPPPPSPRRRAAWSSRGIFTAIP